MQFSLEPKDWAWIADVKVKRVILNLQTARDSKDEKLEKSYGTTSKVKYAFSKSKPAKGQIISVKFKERARKREIRTQEEIKK